MSYFKFQNTDDEGTVTTVEFEAEVWLDAFPRFLALCKASGFIIDEGTALYAPTASRHLFGDRDFLIFEDELIQPETLKGPWPFPHGAPEEVPMDIETEEDLTPQESKTLEQWMAERPRDVPDQHSDCYYDCRRNK